MFHVIVNVLYSQFIEYESFPSDLRMSLERAASYFVKGAQFLDSVKSGKWDGRMYLLNSGGRVPTGLIGILVDLIKEKGYSIKVVNEIVYPQGNPFNWIGPELRDYQIEAVDVALKRRRGIVELPTRSGKTFFAAKLVQMLGLRTLILVNGKESLYQTMEDFKKCIDGVTFGIYGDGKKDVNCDITFATIQSLVKIRGKNPFDDVKVILIDEVHKAAADTIYKFFMRIEAPYRFGMSATAFRMDNKDIKLIALLGRKIYAKNQEEMWDKGIIEKPVIRWVKVSADKLHRAMPYRLHYKAGIIENDYRNKLVEKIVGKCNGAQILISVENVIHGDILVKQLKHYGAVFVHGGVAKKKRMEIFEGVRNGTIKLVIATRIFNESLTFPDLSVLINCAGRKSTLELIQKYGRIQGKGNKSSVVIYDFLDEHSSYLMGHSKKRYKDLEKRGYEQEIISI